MSGTDTDVSGPQTLAWNVAYADGTSHHVTTRPGDYVRLGQQYGAQWRSREDDGPEMMLYLCWLASRHDPTGLARSSFDLFLDDMVSVNMAADPVRPTDAARGNASPSTSPSPWEADPANGSTPTPVPS